MKLRVEKSDKVITQRNEYEDIGGLPINLILGELSEVANYNTYFLSGNGSFIELRFERESCILKQVAFVCIGSVEKKKFSLPETSVCDYYNGVLIESEGLNNNMEYDIKITQNDNRVTFSFRVESNQTFYNLTSGLTIGLNQQGNLCSLLLKGQNELLEELEYMKNIKIV